MMIDTKLARTALVLSLGMAALAGADRPARADRTRIVVVGGAAGDGAKVAAAAAAAVEEAGGEGEVVAAADPTLLSALRACGERQAADACQRVAGQAGGARLLAIELAGGPAAVTLTGWLLVDADEPPLAERRFCDPCSAGALERSAGDLARLLLRETAGAASRSVIRVRTRPPGARVMVDGKAVGVSDLDYTVYPGRHQIRLDRPGYRVEAREVTAPAGATIDLEVELARGEEGGGPRAGGGRGALPWLVGGAGVAAVAGGVVLIALDSPRTDDEGRQNASYRSSLWPGIGLAAAGAGLVGAGIWLWLRRAPGAGASAAPAVAIDAGAGGLWVGGVGRF